MRTASTHHLATRIVAAAFVLAGASCGGGTDAPPSSPNPPTPVLTTLNLSATTAALTAPQTTQLTATTLDQSAKPIAAAVSWSSSASGVASVSATGLVTAVAAGAATVTASATAGTITLTKTAVITVTVPRVTNVTVSPATLPLTVGGTATLAATVVAEAGASTAVSWTSSVATTASVSAAGLVTALAAGANSQVCATSAFDTSKQGCATVTVTAVSTVPVATVAVTPPTSSLSIGQTAQLSAITRDANGNTLTGRVVAWSTSSAAIATVSSSGLVSAVAAGTATITATSENQTGSATITVASPPTVTSVAVTPASSSIAVGQNAQLVASVSGTGSPPTGVSWASADVTKVTVNQSGLAVGVAVTAGTQVCATSTFDTSKSGCGTVIVVAASFPNSATISAPGFAFTPSQVDIALGGTVTYSFTGVTHNVNFDAATGAPANIANTSNANVSRQFNTAGSFGFQCTLHAGMTGMVVVH